MKITLLGACVVIALSSGLLFRFYHIDRKVFWDDEIYSAIRIAGYREEDVIRVAAVARTAADLRAILHPGAQQRESSMRGTVDGLIREDPEHAPLYYVLARLWSNDFGNSVQALRLISVVIGVLAIPAMFWLCFELFRTLRAGWIGAALMAASPIAVLYSQQIREYSLWTVALLVMGAALLRALRLQTGGAWALFSVALAFGLYADILSIFTAIGFAAFVAIDAWERRGTKPHALISFAAGFLAFLPWLIVLAEGYRAVLRGAATILNQRLGAAYILHKLVGFLRLNFFDYNLQSTTLSLILSIPVLALVAYALYVCCRTMPLRRWAFMVAMLFFGTVPFIIHDLLFGGILTSQTRYFIPAYLACDLALVGLFDLMFAGAAQGVRAGLWSAIFAMVLAGRISSSAVSSQATTWWTTFDERSIPIAQTINAATQPLFISDNYVGYVFSVAEYLRPNVMVHIRSACYLCVGQENGQTGAKFDRQLSMSSDVYLLGPSPALQAGVQAAMARSDERARYWCIDVRANCASPLRLWRWVQ